MKKDWAPVLLLLVTLGPAACIVETGPTNGSLSQPRVDFDDLRVGDAMRAPRELNEVTHPKCR